MLPPIKQDDWAKYRRKKFDRQADARAFTDTALLDIDRLEDEDRALEEARDEEFTPDGLRAPSGTPVPGGGGLVGDPTLEWDGRPGGGGAGAADDNLLGEPGTRPGAVPSDGGAALGAPASVASPTPTPTPAFDINAARAQVDAWPDEELQAPGAAPTPGPSPRAGAGTAPGGDAVVFDVEAARRQAEAIDSGQADLPTPPAPTPSPVRSPRPTPTPTTVDLTQGARAGRDVDTDEGLRQVYRDAVAAGLDEEGAKAAMAVALTEGGMGGAVGDRDRGRGSGGTFQLFFGPQGFTGMGNALARELGIDENELLERLSADPHAFNSWVLKGYLGQAIREGQARGLTGAALAEYAQRFGQKSEKPERAAQNYAAATAVPLDDAGATSAAQTPLPAEGPEHDTTMGVDAIVAGGNIRHGYLDPDYEAQLGEAHHGVDIASVRGAPVTTPVAGTVVFAGADDSGANGGIGVVVRTADGHDVSFWHLGGLGDGLRVGAAVRPGDLLGAAGATGNARYVHTHFQVKDAEGNYVDPTPWLGGPAADVAQAAPFTQEPGAPYPGALPVDYSASAAAPLGRGRAPEPEQAPPPDNGGGLFGQIGRAVGGAAEAVGDFLRPRPQPAGTTLARGRNVPANPDAATDPLAIAGGIRARQGRTDDGGVMEALEQLGGPQQVSFAIARALQSDNPQESLKAQLKSLAGNAVEPAYPGQLPQGLPPLRFEEILAGMGMPQGQARAILGRIGDFTLDPLNFLPLGVASRVGRANTVRRIAAEGLATGVAGGVGSYALEEGAGAAAQALGATPEQVQMARTAGNVIGGLGGGIAANVPFRGGRPARGGTSLADVTERGLERAEPLVREAAEALAPGLTTTPVNPALVARARELMPVKADPQGTGFLTQDGTLLDVDGPGRGMHNEAAKMVYGNADRADDTPVGMYRSDQLMAETGLVRWRMQTDPASKAGRYLSLTMARPMTRAQQDAVLRALPPGTPIYVEVLDPRDGKVLDLVRSEGGLADDDQVRRLLGQANNVLNRSGLGLGVQPTEDVAPPFFSPVRRAVESAFERQPKLAPLQLLGTVKKTPGVKPEEIEWTDLERFVLENASRRDPATGKPMPLTKQEVLDHLDQNEVRVEEVQYGAGASGQPRDYEQEAIQMEMAIRTRLGLSDDVDWDVYEDIGMAIQDGSPNAEREAREMMAARGITDSEDQEDLFNQYEEAMRLRMLAMDADESPGPTTAGQTRWSRPDLNTPGGENYRELVLTLPPKKEVPPWQEHPDGIRELPTDHGRITIYPPDPSVTDAGLTGESLRHPTQWTIEYPWQGGYSARPNIIRKPSAESAMAEAQGWWLAEAGDRRRAQTFTHETHWPGVENPLAHVRFNDRVDADGKKVLFIEEVQSDWHQAARPKKPGDEPVGYRPRPNSPESKEAARLRVDLSRLRNNADELRNEIDDLLGGGLSRGWLSDGNLRRPGAIEAMITDPLIGGAGGTHLGSADQVRQKHAEWLAADSAVNDSLTQLRRLEGGPGAPPAAPFARSGAWQELVMKRMVRWAAENGYDRVAWTTGEMQAERYNALLRNVRALEWRKSGNGDFQVRVVGDGDSTMRSFSAPEEELAAHVGNDLASQIVAKPEGGRIEGPITLGGEDKKALYDRMLPSIARKLGEKFGAKVGTTKIEAPSSRNGYIEQLETLRAGTSVTDGEASVLAAVRAELREQARTQGGYASMHPSDVLEMLYEQGDFEPERMRLSPDELQNSIEGVREILQQIPIVNRNAEAHSLDITPAMRGSVMSQGQPLFAAGGLAGLEEDEEGGIGFDPNKAALGMGAGIVGPQLARRLRGATRLQNPALLREVAASVPGSKLTSDGLEMDLERWQWSPHEGTAVEGGVFYAPDSSGYRRPADDFDPDLPDEGGNQRIKGRTLLRSPLVLEVSETGSGGIEEAAAKALGLTEESARKAGVLWDESAVANMARARGYDSMVMAIRMRDGRLLVDEVVDLREAARPSPRGATALRPEFGINEVAGGARTNRGLTGMATDPTLPAPAGRQTTRLGRNLERVSTVRKAGMLFNTATQLVNNVSNAVQTTADVGMKPLAAMIDAVVSGATGKERTRYATETVPQFVGLFGGGWEGLKQVPRILKTGVSPEEAARYDTHATENLFGSGVGAAVAEAPFRVLAAADAVWRGAARGGHAAALAHRQATKEGLRGAERSKRALEILDNLDKFPMIEATARDVAERRSLMGEIFDVEEETARIQQRAHASREVDVESRRLARRTVFQEERGELQALQNLKQKAPPEVKFAVDLVVPFMNTPYNVAAQGAGMTPFGFLAAIKSYAKGDRGEGADRAARALVGTGLGAYAFQLAANGYLTGAYPEDAAERTTLPEGWKPFALRIPRGEGAVYVPIAFFGAFSMPMGIAAVMAHGYKEGTDLKDPTRAAIRAFGAVADYVSEQTFLQGMRMVSDIIGEPERWVNTISENIAGSFVPFSSLLRQYEQFQGAPLRDPSGPIEAIIAGVPYLNRSIPERQTPMGEPRRPTVTGPQAFLTGTRISVEKDEPTLKAMREARVSLPRQGREALGFQITGAEARDVQRRAGPYLREYVDPIVGQDWFKELPLQARGALLEKMRDIARQQARAEVIGNVPAEELGRRAGVKAEAESRRRPPPRLP